jgi:hypothetical protein
MFGETPSSRRGGSFFARMRESHSFARLGEPLLSDGSTVSDAIQRPMPRLLLWAMVPLAGMQLAFGAGEKVMFARMASVLPHSCLLIHTHLAALNALLYSLLQVARSQSRASPVPDRLRRVKPTRVLVMGLLDATHSLLVIDAAETLRGTTQATLLQSALPLSVLALALTTRLKRRVGRSKSARRGWRPAVQSAAAVAAAAAILAAMLASPVMEPGSQRYAPASTGQGAAIPEGAAAGWKPTALWEAEDEYGGWAESHGTAAEMAHLSRRGAAADWEGWSGGGYHFVSSAAEASTQRLRLAAAGEQAGLAGYLGPASSGGGSSAVDGPPTLLFGALGAHPRGEPSAQAPVVPGARVGAAHRVAAPELREGGRIWLLANRSLAALQASPRVCDGGRDGAAASSFFSLGHGDAGSVLSISHGVAGTVGGAVASPGVARAGGADGGGSGAMPGFAPATSEDSSARDALAAACRRLRGASLHRVVEASEQTVAGIQIGILAALREAGGQPGGRAAGVSAQATADGGAAPDCQLRLEVWRRPWLHSDRLESASLACPVPGPAAGTSEALVQAQLLSSPLLLGEDWEVTGGAGGDATTSQHRELPGDSALAEAPGAWDASAGLLGRQPPPQQLFQEQQQQQGQGQQQQQQGHGQQQQQQQQKSSNDDAPAAGQSVPAAFHSDPVRSRLLFVAGVAASVCSTSLKGRWLAEAPVDVLLLNTYVPLTQLVAGFGIGPLLLFVVHGQPIGRTLRDTGRSLYCYVASLVDAVVSGPDKTDEEQKRLASLSQQFGLRTWASEDSASAGGGSALGAWSISAGEDGPASAQREGSSRLGARSAGGEDARRAGGSGMDGGGDEGDSGGASGVGWSCACEETNLLPILLIFFIVSSLWSALSFVLLCWGPPPFLNLTAALLYPATLFGFISPIRRESWPVLAPPEPFGPAQVAAATLLSASIAAFFFATTGCCGLSRGRTFSSKANSPETDLAAASSSAGTSPPGRADEADAAASTASTAFAMPPRRARSGHERAEPPAAKPPRRNSSSSVADMQHVPARQAPRTSGAAGGAAPADGRFDGRATRAPEEPPLGLGDGAPAQARRQPVQFAPAGAAAHPAANESIFAWQ